MGQALAEEVLGVAGLRHDLEARPSEHARDSFAQEDIVLADHPRAAALTSGRAYCGPAATRR